MSIPTPFICRVSPGHVASVCTPSLHVVRRCCAKFETRQTISCAKTDATTKIGDKIVETLFLNRVISENKRIHTPLLSPPFKVGVFVVFYR